MQMIELRCKKCNRLLGKVSGSAEIVCPRCGGINIYSYINNKTTYQSRLKKQRERTTSSGVRFE